MTIGNGESERSPLFRVTGINHRTILRFSQQKFEALFVAHRRSAVNGRSFRYVVLFSSFEK